MKKILITLIMAMTITMSISAQIYDEKKNTMEQIDQAITKANNEGKMVCCQVGGNWCPWCIKFAKFITEDTEIKDIVSNNFVYEHVNYPSRKGDRAALRETMNRLSNPQRFGFPVMVVLDNKGNVIHIQDSSYLEENNSYNKEKVMSFFKNWTKQAIEGK